MVRRALLLLLILPLMASAELYRWTDEEGRVHFGDRAPGDSSSAAERVEVTPPKPIGQGNDLKQINERLNSLREQEQERLKAQQEQAQQEARKKEKACKAALKHYNRLQRNFVYKREDGSTYQVSRQQALEDRAEVRKWLDDNCPGM
jgi:hypothetical protein